MKKIFIKTCLLVCLVLIAGFSVSCNKKCKEHDYVDGVCSKCEAVDPDYKPHVHEYVEGVCECGEKDPNYVSPLDQFKAAMDELQTASSTINCNMVMTVSYTMGNQSESMTQNMTLYIENDSTKAYTIVSSEGMSEYTYAVIEGENVKTYLKYNNEWLLLETTTIEEYSGMEDLLDVEVEDAFTLQNGIWVGNVEVLSASLSKVIVDSFGEIDEVSGMTLDEASVKKYNITMTEGKLSLVDIEMYMKMSYQGMVMEYTITMPMAISKVGETTVTVPENLPVE